MPMPSDNSTAGTAGKRLPGYVVPIAIALFVLLSLLLCAATLSTYYLTHSGKVVTPFPDASPSHPEQAPLAQTTPTSGSANTVELGDLLELYRDLAKANEQAVKSASATLDVGIVAASAIVVLLTGSGIWIHRTASSAAELATSTSELAQKLSRDVTELAEMRKRLESGLAELDLRLQKGQDSLSQLESSERDLRAKLEEHRQLVSSDKIVLERLNALAEVDKYAMSLFGDDRVRRQNAKKSLRQLSANEDPIVRRECLRVFKKMPDMLDDWLDDDMFGRIRQIARSDKERGVRQEAEHTAERWEDRKRLLPDDKPQGTLAADA